MRAASMVNCWTKAWGLALFLLEMFPVFPAQAQQSPITDAAAQDSAPKNRPHKHHHYQLVDLGSTFGGPNSNFDPGSGNDLGGFVSVLNSGGTVAGFAETAVSDPFAPICFWNCLATHAFRAGRNGVLTDLGTLPGGVNSAALWISENGLIAGLSENGETDPLYPGLGELHAVLWQHGKITDLGTLPEGGYESEANAVNSSGQVVGGALNTIPDANSMQTSMVFTFWLWGGIVPPYQYQTRAFLWDKQTGMQDLGTLPGGTDAQARLINERGQVVGYSYTGSTPSGYCFPLATSSFLWEKGKGMVDLGGFGGTCTAAADLNNQGQIVGISTVTGDAFERAFLWEHGAIHDFGGSLGGNNTGAFVMNDEGQAVGYANLPGERTYHATLWTQVGKMTDLGTLGNDPCSFATGINAGGQVVGASTDCNSIFRAFLWEDGSLFDLNALIPAGSSLSVTQTYTINSRGEIAGEGRDGGGHDHALLLIPCDEDHADVEGCDYDPVDEAAAATLSNSTAMTDGLVATSSTQQLAAGEVVAARDIRMLRLPHITGAATHAGVSFPQTMAAIDSRSPAVQKLTITSGTPPRGTVGKAYDVHCHIPLCGGSIVVGFPLAASGGVPPYSWTWAPQPGSSLPPSLSITQGFPCVHIFFPNHGICGTPTHAGTYNVTVKVTDSASPPAHASANYTIDID